MISQFIKINLPLSRHKKIKSNKVLVDEAKEDDEEEVDETLRVDSNAVAKYFRSRKYSFDLWIHYHNFIVQCRQNMEQQEDEKLFFRWRVPNGWKITAPSLHYILCAIFSLYIHEKIQNLYFERYIDVYNAISLSLSFFIFLFNWTKCAFARTSMFPSFIHSLSDLTSEMKDILRCSSKNCIVISNYVI